MGKGWIIRWPSRSEAKLISKKIGVPTRQIMILRKNYLIAVSHSGKLIAWLKKGEGECPIFLTIPKDQEEKEGIQKDLLS